MADAVDQKRIDIAEGALKEARRRFKSVFDSLALTALILDKNCRVIFANDFLIRTIGWERDEILGENWIDLVIPEDQKGAAWESFKNFLIGHEIHQPHEREVLTKSRERRYIRWSVTYLIDQDGVIEGTASIGEDITELLRARVEIQRNQKFESLGLLAGGIAHDFNNLLTVLVGNISLSRLRLNGDAGYADVCKYLADAEGAVVRATALTRQLLTFAQESGRAKKNVIDLGSLLRESAGFSTHGTSVECEFDMPGDLWLVEVDDGQISQVFQNLIINAVQAMPNGGKIRISGENVTSKEDRRFVRIVIADNGVGMSAETLAKVFDPYFTTKATGNGLGLATSYAVAKAHGGKITASSTLGSGCAFIVSLPAADSASVVEPEATSETVWGRGRILLLDDDETVSAVAKTMLNELGYEVECVKSGVDVVPYYTGMAGKGTPFAAVILDLTVPGGLGAEEIVKLLLEEDPGAVAIVSSGYATNPIMVDYQEVGFKGALVKPYQLQELSKILGDLLDGGRAPGSAKGQIAGIAADFDELPEDFKEYIK